MKTSHGGAGRNQGRKPSARPLKKISLNLFADQVGRFSADEIRQAIDGLLGGQKAMRLIGYISRMAQITYGSCTSCRAIASEIWRAQTCLICYNCGGEMQVGKAIINAQTGDPEWLDGDMEGATLSASGEAKVVACIKCLNCGHSFVP